MDTSRFYCASASLRLGMLLKQAQKALWGAMILAIVVHLLLPQIGSRQATQQTAKPLTTQFVKRQPRLTKPLELKKRPQPKRRRIQREMISVKARVDRKEVVSSIQVLGVINTLAKPQIDVSRSIHLDAGAYEPEAMASIIEGSMEPENKINMALEMVDISALDTGEYHAMVIQDPNDKMNIKGFFHIAKAFPANMAGRRKVGDVNRSARAVARLCQALNRWTQIKADLVGSIPLDSAELLKTPWIYVQARYPFELTASEESNLGLYLLSGGFQVVDTVLNGPDRPAELSLMKMVKGGLAAQNFRYGRDWDFEVIPHSHAIYHCYYDCPHGPPPCGEFWYISKRYLGKVYKNLHAVFKEGRTIVIFSRIWLGNAWGDWNQPPFSDLYQSRDNTRELQFGINIVIFALTQEGSITNRVMDSVQ